MIFWDSSAVVPLLVSEPKTHEAQSALKNDRYIMVWCLTFLEATSALNRRLRSEAIHFGHYRAGEERLKKLNTAWDQILFSDKLVNLSARLLRTHPLRTADSLQLAAALVAGGSDPSQINFFSYDDRLNEAAAREGLTLFPQIQT
jgi:predicted nucleic acid-binding protein